MKKISGVPSYVKKKTSEKCCFLLPRKKKIHVANAEEQLFKAAINYHKIVINDNEDLIKFANDKHKQLCKTDPCCAER